jgi:hypothetical protein
MGTETRSDERPSAARPGDAGRGDAYERRATEAGKEQTSAIWSETKESVRSALGEKQAATAADIGDFARALRSAARQIEHNAAATRIAEQTADGLERLSGTLRGKDLNTLVREIESFARAQPAVFLGTAVAAGFLVTRFLKSSGTPENRFERRGDSVAPSGPYGEGEQPY